MKILKLAFSTGSALALAALSASATGAATTTTTAATTTATTTVTTTATTTATTGTATAAGAAAAAGISATAAGTSATAAGTSATAAGGATATATGTARSPRPDFRRACAAAQAPGSAECLALVRTGVTSFEGRARDAVPAGYGPADLQSAYNLALAATAAGTGETVAVVDAYDDPDAASDLAVYRAHYHLPACAGGCFSKVNQEGKASPLPKRAGTSGWATEESLDVDMVSAICPKCRILLVEANNGAVANLGEAVDAAAALGARFVSNSYSSSETRDEVADDAAYYDHRGVAVTAAAGDSGYGVGYPAASEYVTAVGGTSLVRRTVRKKSTARAWGETVWNTGSGSTGSGCARYEAKPPWQTDAGCSRRTDNDVAADANPSTGVAVYDGYDQGGWLEAGGTSVSAPIIAATYALAGPPLPGSYPAEYPYEHTGDLYDVTSGSDGSCGGSYLCTARVGYNGPAGWGTPDGTGAFQAVDRSVAIWNPGDRHSRKGVAIRTLAIAATDTSAGQAAAHPALTFAASGLPPGLSISAGGLVSGRPSTMGFYHVRVRATDVTGMTGSASFTWTVDSVGAIRLLAGCLNDRHGSAADHGRIDIRPCDGSRAQAWLTDPRGGGMLRISLARARGTCLTAPASRTGQVTLQRCGSVVWRAGSDGHLVNSRSGRCLAGQDPGPAGARLGIARCADTAAQRWDVR